MTLAGEECIGGNFLVSGPDRVGRKDGHLQGMVWCWSRDAVKWRVGPAWGGVAWALM